MGPANEIRNKHIRNNKWDHGPNAYISTDNALRLGTIYLEISGSSSSDQQGVNAQNYKQTSPNRENRNERMTRILLVSHRSAYFLTNITIRN